MSVIKEECIDIGDDDYDGMNFNEDSQTNRSTDIGQDEIQNMDDESLLRVLLHRFEMGFLLPFLKDADIKYRNLRYLSVDDINAAIRSIGNRAEFREKLFAWRREKYRTNDVTIEGGKKEIINTELTALQSSLEAKPNAIKIVACESEPVEKEVNALTEVETATATKIAAPVTSPLSGSKLGTILNLTNLMDKSQFGDKIRKFYNRNGYLERIHRDELIQIIINYLMDDDIRLHCSDFERIIDEIVSIFPSEADAKDYYFIKRNGKRNPMGRLYSKYNNSKRRRLNQSVDIESCYTANNDMSGSVSANETAVVAANVQMDEASLVALKNFLRCDGVDWQDVDSLWAKTFVARQQDLRRFASFDEFFAEWPKYLTPRGTELFSIDFDQKFPQKSELLHSKWAEFKPKIYRYYSRNINNETCKNLLAICCSKPSKDIENYLLTTLLNAVLPPLARFRDSSGTNKRKASIADAIEWFAIRVNSIEELPARKEELLQKYCAVNMENAPSLVVVGDNTKYEITDYYVSFMRSLYKQTSFLDALDVCLKIFRVLELPYPPTTSYTWTFIQRYFYDINLPQDAKAPSLISLYSYLAHS